MTIESDRFLLSAWSMRHESRRCTNPIYSLEFKRIEVTLPKTQSASVHTCAKDVGTSSQLCFPRASWLSSWMRNSTVFRSSLVPLVIPWTGLYGPLPHRFLPSPMCLYWSGYQFVKDYASTYTIELFYCESRRMRIPNCSLHW